MGHRRTAAVAALTLSLLGFSDAVRLPTLSSLRRTPVAARHASCVNCAAEAESVSTPVQSVPTGRIGTQPAEPLPLALVEERDACGVGFIADLKGRRRHDTIARTLTALGCMEHRGGCGGDGVSGDGAGVLTAVPWELLEAEGALQGKPSANCAVAMTFLPQAEEDALAAQAIFEAQAAKRGLQVLGWRDVPQDKESLGELARIALPIIRQAIIHHPDKTGDDLEDALCAPHRRPPAPAPNPHRGRLPPARRPTSHPARLPPLLPPRRYAARRSAQADFAASPQGEVKTTYFASVSSRTIVYKGMVQSCVLGPFYKDLTNELFQTNFAIYHRRFSTNTVPKWPLAQPMRCLAHNGEINTLIGNVNWQRALDIQVCPTR